MKINSHKLFLQFVLVFFVLIWHVPMYGQWGEVIKLEQNGRAVNTLEITIASQDGNEKKINLNIKTSSQSASRIENGTILILSPNTSIGIKSANSNEVYLTAEQDEKILEYLVTSYREVYRSLDDNESGNILTRVFEPVAGDVKTANIDQTINGAADGTEWQVTNQGSALDFKIIEGKVTVSGRSKIEIEDDILNLEDENHTRILYLTEVLEQLKPSSQEHLFHLDSLNKPPLKSERNIEEFFKTKLAQEKRILRSSGSHCNTGFKHLHNGEFTEGINAYTKAIEQGEIDANRFVQASLILTEAYHEISTKKTKTHSSYQSPDQNKNKEIWLEASLHFIKKIDSVNKQKFNMFKSIDHKEISKAFGHDLVLSTQYQAWAYTVKLKITGCLEHSSQNPILLMEKATKLNDSLKTY